MRWKKKKKKKNHWLGLYLAVSRETETLSGMNCNVAIYFRLAAPGRDSVSNFNLLQILKPYSVIPGTFKFIENTTTHVKFFYIVIGMHILECRYLPSENEVCVLAWTDNMYVTYASYKWKSQDLDVCFFIALLPSLIIAMPTHSPLPPPPSSFQILFSFNLFGFHWE